MSPNISWVRTQLTGKRLDLAPGRQLSTCYRPSSSGIRLKSPSTHDVCELLDLVAGCDSELSVILRLMAIRYPGDLTDALTREDARSAVMTAILVRDVVRMRLGFDL